MTKEINFDYEKVCREGKRLTEEFISSINLNLDKADSIKEELELIYTVLFFAESLIDNICKSAHAELDVFKYGLMVLKNQSPKS